MAAATNVEPLSIYLQDPSTIPGIGPERGRRPRGSATTVARYVSPHGSYRYVFYVAGQPAAALQVMSRDRRHAVIANVYTAPTARRRGLATALLVRARQDFKTVEHAPEHHRSVEGSAWASANRTRGPKCCFNRRVEIRERGAALTLRELEAALVEAGEKPTQQFHGATPFVAVIDGGDGARIAGRFFPSRNAVLVLRHKNPEVTRATVNHELAHAATYADKCDGTSTMHRSRCPYHGEHDAHFYEVLEQIHRSSGVGLEAARTVEGDYDYPQHWRTGRDWAA